MKINNAGYLQHAMTWIGGWVCRKSGVVYRRIMWEGNYYAFNDDDYHTPPYGIPDLEKVAKCMRPTESFCDNQEYAEIPCIHPCYIMSQFVKDFSDQYNDVFCQYGLYSFSQMAKCPVFTSPYRTPRMSEIESRYYDAFIRMTDENQQVSDTFEEYDKNLVTPRIMKQWCEANGFEW